VAQVGLGVADAVDHGDLAEVPTGPEVAQVRVQAPVGVHVEGLGRAHGDGAATLVVGAVADRHDHVERIGAAVHGHEDEHALVGPERGGRTGDTVEGEILSALLRDAGFLGYNAGRPPAFTIRRGMTSAAERRIGTLQITFRLTQQTVDYDPDDVSAENSFEIAHIESDLAPGDDAVDSEQTLTLDGDP